MTTMIGKSDHTRKIQIGVIGNRNLNPDANILHREIMEIARRVGHTLAKREVICINGGMTGVMEAVSQGVRDNNGLSVGIIPSDEKNKGNASLTVRIATGMTKEERRALVVKSSDALIVISGEEGTKEESKIAIQLGIPLISIPSTGGVAKELVENEDFQHNIEIAETAEEAVDLAIAAANLSFQLGKDLLSDFK